MIKNNILKILLVLYILLSLSYIYILNIKILSLKGILSDIIYQGKHTLESYNSAEKTVLVHIIVTNEKNGIVLINGIPIFCERIEKERQNYPSFGVIIFNVNIGSNICIYASDFNLKIQKVETFNIKEETYFQIKIDSNIKIIRVPASKGSIGVL